MARISKDSIQQIKDTIRISDVFEWLGARVVRKGHNTMAYCPFCEDAHSKSPGCSLNDELGLFHCFVCQESGDTISAVMDHESVNFPEAVEMIANQFDVELKYEKSADPEAESRRRRLVSVLEAAQEEFVAQREDSHYSQFLEQRSIAPADAERFELGMSLYDRADAVTTRLVEKFGEEDVIASGLAYKDEQTGKLVLRFKNRLMFPIRTTPGTLVGFGGRDLTGRSKAKYKNSPESDLFKKRNILYGMNLAKKAIGKAKRAIVCEGHMDTLALQSHGFEYSVGAMGTALTLQNLQHLSTLASIIYISLDSDAAGVAAAMRTAETMPEDFRSEVKVLVIPEVECHNEEEVRKTSLAKADEYLVETVTHPDGSTEQVPVSFPVMVPMAKDPDEFFNQVGHTPEEFEEIMEGALDIFLFCAQKTIAAEVEALDAELDKEQSDTVAVAQLKMEARRKLDDMVVRLYRKMNVYQRQNVANYAIEALRLIDTAKQLEDEWKKRAVTSAGYSSARAGAQPSASRRDTLGTFNSAMTSEEDMLIATLYFHPECRLIIRDNIENLEQVFTSPVRRSIFDKIDAAYGRGRTALQAQNEDMDENEIKEIGRIIMNLNADEERSKELSDDTIKQICTQMEKHALKNAIELESQAATPDVMKIIEMKMKLGTL